MKNSFKKLICVCHGRDCRNAGSGKLYKIFRKRIQEGNAGTSTFLCKTKCLDLCKKGPVIIVDNHIFTGFTKQDMDDCFSDG